MFKRLILAVLISLPISVFAQKFGVVDAEAVIQAMPEYIAMDTQIGEASKKYEAEHLKLKEEIDKKYTEFQALNQDPNTPQAIKERRIQEIQELDQKDQQFLSTATQDLQRMQQQLMAPIQQKFLDAIKAVGQEGNYTFILPRGVAAYEGAGVEDVTAAVKAKLGITN